MPRVKAFLDCLGLSICEKARKALFGTAPFGEFLPDIAKATLEAGMRQFSREELRLAIAETINLDSNEYRDRLVKLIEALGRVQALPFKAELADYLRHFPAMARRFLTRPSDPKGKSLPEAMTFFKPDELMMLLPPHRPTLRIGHEPAGLESWKLRSLLGVGATAETWLVEHANEPGRVSTIKFAVEIEAKAAVPKRTDLFEQVFALANIQGVVPLSAVYLETDPPALESPYVAGYDLASLMWDWRWKYDVPKPQAALQLMKKMCEILSKVHAAGVVHRNLKPSNIRLQPTESGKLTLWITDFGWSHISSERSLHLSKSQIPRGEQLWLSYRGAHTPLYASPQQVRKEEPDPRDDVYALGVIWYQLLRRDPHLEAPIGTEWADELHDHGVTDSQARLLSACLSTRPEKRPNNVRELAEYLDGVTVADPKSSGGTDGSRLVPVKGHSTAMQQTVGKSSTMAPVAPPKSTEPGYGGLPRTITNSAGIDLALIAPGTFLMGSPEGEPGRREHEGPQREIALTKPYYLSVGPITQAQFEKVMGRNPATFSRGHGGAPEHPVENLTWDEAVEFCDRLSRLPDEALNARAYRLPTEAEWEYACRSGTTTPFAFGDKLTPKEAHFAGAGAFGKSGGKPQTVPVGKFPPNEFGLVDCHGNVQEWTADWYDEYAYHEQEPENPTGPTEGTMRVVRGGCYTMFASDCRSAARRGHPPESATPMIGFRVLLIVEA